MPNSVKQMSPARLNKATRRRDALELRKVGADYEQIAGALGYTNAKAASRDVHKALADLPTDNAEQLRRVLERQYVALAAVHWPKAMKGDISALHAWESVTDRLRQLRALDEGKDGGVQPTFELHQHDHEGDSVLIVGGDTDTYIAALKRGVGVVDGNPGGTTYVQNESNDDRDA